MIHMEIILAQTVHLKTMNQGWSELRKIINSDFVPRKGDFIEDTVWKGDDHQEVQSVVINYGENYCFVYLPAIDLGTDEKEVLEQYEDMAKLHGWSSSSERLSLR